MVSIRRKLGAFVVAIAVAAVMVITPASVEAKNNKGSLDAFCAELASAIEYLEGVYDNAAVDLVLAQLRATYNAYCTTN